MLKKLEDIAFNGKNATAQMKALELLGKHLGLWEKSASEVNAPSEVPMLYKALEADDE